VPNGNVFSCRRLGGFLLFFPGPKGLSNMRLTGKGELARIVRQERSDYSTIRDKRLCPVEAVVRRFFCNDIIYYFRAEVA